MISGAMCRAHLLSLSHTTHAVLQVLFDVSGSVRPNEVLALMGPSGSGKTSLLSIMGARDQKQMKSEGTVTFNGQPLTKRLKRRVGYVLQVCACWVPGRSGQAVTLKSSAAIYGVCGGVVYRSCIDLLATCASTAAHTTQQSARCLTPSHAHTLPPFLTLPSLCFPPGRPALREPDRAGDSVLRRHAAPAAPHVP